MKRYIIFIALVSMSSIYQIVSADVNELVEDCNSCHGKDGVSTDTNVPTIAGFSELYLMDSMAIYADEDRPCPEAEYPEGPDKGDKTTMCEIADDLSSDEIDEIAAYYAAKQFVPAKQDFDAALAKKGREVHDDLCEKCHSVGGSLASDDAGILAGQWIGYQKFTFEAYEEGDRPQPKKMKTKMKKLDEETTRQLIHYYASQQ